jgi:hypothetical protein
LSKRHGLSKSKITAFEQCPKRLWLQKHKPDAAVTDDGAQARFATGDAVGEIACALCPDGVMIKAEPDLGAALEQTQRLLTDGFDRPIFEATFERDGVLIRADMMEPDGNGAWLLAEVKSSTSVKDYHVGDIATQLWVLEGAGIKVSSASLRHINNKFELTEIGQYQGLLTDTDIAARAKPIAATRGATVTAAREVLSGDEPKLTMGNQCTSPFTCEFQSYCSAQEDTPELEWPVALLPRTGKRLAAEYAAKGIFELKDVPPAELRHKNHEKIRIATCEDRPFHDAQGVIAETDGWAFPLIHLDFETCNLAIPRWIGTRPYQQIPFQFSAHIQSEDGGVEHFEFLDLSGNDPRLGCAKALANLPASGAAVAWNASFERSRLRELAEALPDYSSKLTSLADRLVDLKVIAEKHYYHRDQRGSWSIKAVLPTLAPELNYSTLEIKGGGKAVEVYEQAIAASVSSDEREAISDALKEYCRRDTWAMVVLLAKLRSEAIPAATA